MIKNIVFDISNVLAPFRFKEFLAEKGFDGSTYYCLRLRARFAEDGSVIGAHYGKLCFQHGIGSTAQTVFVRAENELWLE